MDFDRIKSIKEIHEKFLIETKRYSENLQALSDKLGIFYHSIYQLKEVCLENNLNHQFKQFDSIFKGFAQQLKKFIEPLENNFLLLINNLGKKIKDKKNESIEIFNSLNLQLIKENELNKKKFDCMNNSNKHILFESEPDKNEFNESLNKSYMQIYQYEVDSIRNQIEKEYLNYENKNKEINDIINNPSEILSPLTIFLNYILKFSEALRTLYSDLKNQLDNINISKEGNNLNKNSNESFIKKNDEDDYFIINNDGKIDIDKNIEDIIQKIINNDKNLKLQEIININKILEIDINNKKKKNTRHIFLSKISDKCLNGVIIVQNECNFIYLSNILNVIILQENTKDIYSKIILISNHIKYKNKYLYEILRKNNKYLRTKSFWTKLIEQELIKKINDNINDQLNDKDGKDGNKIKEKTDINSIIKNLGIKKEISSDFKKLNFNQIKRLNNYIQEYIVLSVKNYIPLMHKFLLKNQLISEILKNYRDQLRLNNNLVNHLQDLSFIYYLNSKYRKIYISANNNKKYKILIVVSELLKYLPIEDYMKFTSLNKSLNQDLKRIVFKNIFGYKDLSLELHIKYLGQYLKIFEIEKMCDYNKLKQDFILYLKGNNIDPNINKKNELIKNDLKRTIFVQNNPTHKEAIESILLVFNYSFKDIGYYQGFNIIVSFLYQLLNYNEEKTFYFFYGLQFNTKYNLIFRSKLAFLNILFSVFEKIIKLNIPEILSIIKNIKVDLDYFCSSWFTTLFIGNVNTFNNGETPLLLIYFIEKFCINGWSAIFNLGLTVLEIGYEKIIKLEKEELIKYIMKIVSEENIFDNNNFEKCKLLYEKHEKIINEKFVEKLIEIIKFENENNYLINN